MTGMSPDPTTDPRLALPAGELRGPDGQPLAVPPEGSLGLLALGWVGLRLWRDARTAGGWSPATRVAMRAPAGDGPTGAAAATQASSE
jgi:hypothetical protein